MDIPFRGWDEAFRYWDDFTAVVQKTIPHLEQKMRETYPTLDLIYRSNLFGSGNNETLAQEGIVMIFETSVSQHATKVNFKKDILDTEAMTEEAVRSAIIAFDAFMVILRSEMDIAQRTQDLITLITKEAD